MSETNRPGTSAELPPDLTALRSLLERSAVQRLTATNWFPPFAVAMQSDGNIVDYSASLPAEQATPETIYNVLVQGLTTGARQGRFRAAALCHGVAMKDSGHHAIRMVLEQRDGTALQVIAPYVKHVGGKPTLQAATVTAAKAVVFADHEF